MTYLLAKYVLVSILATLAGYAFGRWMSHRKDTDDSAGIEPYRGVSGDSDAEQWDRLWRRLDSIPEPQEINLTGIQERLDGIAYAVTNLSATRILETGVDLNPVNKRLQLIELRLRELSNGPAELSSSRDRSVGAMDDQSTILKEAVFGRKDNLHRISGIGSKLEQLLNKNGIFYFWQIASWTDSDIEIIDERLDTFKGRIGRDKWVSQAGTLCREPGSAQQPTEMRISA